MNGCFFACGMRMVFRVMEPRWSINPAKLWMGSPLALRLIAFLDFAAADGSVAATGEERSARARVIWLEYCKNTGQVIRFTAQNGRLNLHTTYKSFGRIHRKTRMFSRT